VIRWQEWQARERAFYDGLAALAGQAFAAMMQGAREGLARPVCLYYWPDPGPFDLSRAGFDPSSPPPGCTGAPVQLYPGPLPAGLTLPALVSRVTTTAARAAIYKVN
jgi:hypothetical protein